MGSLILLPLLLLLFSGMHLLSDARNFKNQWSKTSRFPKESHPRKQWDSISSLPLLSDTRYLERQWSKTSRVTKASYPNGHRDSFSNLRPLSTNSKYMEGPWSKTTMFPKKSHIKGHEDSFPSLPPLLDARYPNVPCCWMLGIWKGNGRKVAGFSESLIKGDGNSSKGSSCTHDPNKKGSGGDKCPIPP